jgi:hypothetical protein
MSARNIKRVLDDDLLITLCSFGSMRRIEKEFFFGNGSADSGAAPTVILVDI